MADWIPDRLFSPGISFFLPLLHEAHSSPMGNIHTSAVLLLSSNRVVFGLLNVPLINALLTLSVGDVGWPCLGRLTVGIIF